MPCDRCAELERAGVELQSRLHEPGAGVMYNPGAGVMYNRNMAAIRIHLLEAHGDEPNTATYRDIDKFARDALLGMMANEEITDRATSVAASREDGKLPSSILAGWAYDQAEDMLRERYRRYQQDAGTAKKLQEPNTNKEETL